MATWGISSTDAFYAYGEYTYTQDTEKKETYVKTYVRVKRYGNGGGSVGVTGQIQIGGDFYRQAGTINLASAGTTTLISKDYTLKHTEDGSVPTGIGLQFSMAADGVWKYSQHKTFDEIIPKIKVGRKISNDSSETNLIEFGKEVTFSLTTPVAGYTADVYYKIGETIYNIATGTTAETIKYVFKEELINSFTETDEPIIQVFCKTNDTGVEYSTNVYLFVPDAYAPGVTLIKVDNLPNKPEVLKTNQIWVQNKSILEGRITATPKRDAYIKSYLSSLSDFDQVYLENPFITQPLTVTGNRVISVTATDSRGKSTTITDEIVVTPYQAPAIIETRVERCLEDGTVSQIGTYAKITCKYKISPIENLNTMKLTVQLNNGDEVNVPLTNYEDEVSLVAFENIDQAQSYNITFNLSDALDKTKQGFLLGIAYMTESKLAGGKGITFGQVATEEGFHNYMDSHFHKEVEMPSVIGKTDFKDGASLNGKDFITADSLQRHIITVGYNSSTSTHQELTTSEANFKLNTVLSSVGNKITLDTTNNAIKIGAGVKKIMLSACLTFNYIGTSGSTISVNFTTVVRKNSELIQRIYTVKPTPVGGSYYTASMPQKLLDVEEGDLITLQVFASNTPSNAICNTDAVKYNFVTAEVVE